MYKPKKVHDRQVTHFVPKTTFTWIDRSGFKNTARANSPICCTGERSVFILERKTYSDNEEQVTCTKCLSRLKYRKERAA